MTYFQICLYFLVYSFGGWVVEVIFHAVALGKVINRGFLNGPVCPVYGFGVLSVLPCLIRFKVVDIRWVKEWSLYLDLFLLQRLSWSQDGCLMCFHARWWDYSDKPLNFHGYICLEFSLIWGLAIVMVVKVFQKYVENQVSHTPATWEWSCRCSKTPWFSTPPTHTVTFTKTDRYISMKNSTGLSGLVHHRHGNLHQATHHSQLNRL